MFLVSTRFSAENDLENCEKCELFVFVRDEITWYSRLVLILTAHRQSLGSSLNRLWVYGSKGPAYDRRGTRTQLIMSETNKNFHVCLPSKNNQLKSPTCMCVLQGDLTKLPTLKYCEVKTVRFEQRCWIYALNCYALNRAYCFWKLFCFLQGGTIKLQK